MNSLEKRSFYSFLGLYIFSSLLFIVLVGYWYYVAQKRALENETYYQLEHLADMKAGEIIVAHMHHHPLRNIPLPPQVSEVLIDTNNSTRQGKLVAPHLPLQPGYFHANGYNILISDAPRDHLGIRYIVLQTTMPTQQIATLQALVIRVIFISFVLVVVVAWILSRLFMRPLRQRVAQIEHFINDITHELNTPITALSMATDQALKQGEATPKTLKNISISTRQLYDIYRSLTYLNFTDKEERCDTIDLGESIKKSIAYYRPLAEVKRIQCKVDIDSCSYRIPESQVQLLLGNLMGNAIKYSPRGSTITIGFAKGVLQIQDEGIGIEPEKQKEIFERFRRGTAYAGGFGVGLSVVKSICDRYGITITLHSVPNEGSCFRLVFEGNKGIS